MPSILERYQKLNPAPFGRFVFNFGVGFVAPFFAKIRPAVVELMPAYCEVEIKDRRALRNQLGGVSSGALSTLAELTGYLAIDSCIPEHMRWTYKGMAIKHIKQGNGRLRSSCRVEIERWRVKEYVVPVVIRDAGHNIVLTADITFQISQKGVTAPGERSKTV